MARFPALNNLPFSVTVIVPGTGCVWAVRNLRRALSRIIE